MEKGSKEWQIEEQYLQDTLKMIKEQIASSSDKVDNYKDNIIKAQKSMWENRSTESDPTKDLEGAATAWQHQSYMMMESKSMTYYGELKERLMRMYQSPYFGRMDFIEDGEEETLYIGMGKLSGDNFAHIQVYDWRSPVCSMFYNYEIGDASYECPAGVIEGKLSLKRQYKIKDSILEYLFDSGLKINDEMLQEILGHSTDDKMKTIVTSIQKEQDQLIRDESHQVLVIQGSAGSGKTSIALHRIAYILYRQRERMSAQNMVIFSPNEVFNDYISDVLPELGEENVNLTTFGDYLDTVLDTGKQVEDWNSQMEYILSSGANHGKMRKRCITFKTSKEFVDIIDRYVTYIREEGFEFRDLKYKGQMIISAKRIKKLYIENQKILSPKKSLNRIRLRLHKQLEPIIASERKRIKDTIMENDQSIFEEERKEKVNQAINQSFADVRRQINEMTRMSVPYLYKSLFRSLKLQKTINNGHALFDLDMVKYTANRLDSKYTFYEDALAMAYLKGELEGVPLVSDIKHIVIDEAQDYGYIHYAIFKQIFHQAGFTLLGDLNQSINPHMSVGQYENMMTLFDGSTKAKVTLSKSYRSTKEISGLCSQLLNKEDKTVYIDRHGDVTNLCQYEDGISLVKSVNEKLQSYIEAGYQSAAIICKTEKECKKLYHALDNDSIKMITRQDIHYKQGIVIVPSYMAKGLEFDAVMVVAHEHNHYKDELERNLFYTVCSRALHKLEILYTDERPVFIKDEMIDEGMINHVLIQ